MFNAYRTVEVTVRKWRSVPMHEEAVVRDLVDGEGIALPAPVGRPDFRVECLFDRVLDNCLQSMIQAVETCNAPRAAHFADKIVQYANPHYAGEFLSVARFVQGYLAFTQCNHRLAARRFRQALRGPKPIEVAAHNNLGVVLALRRRPVTAHQHFEQALLLDPALVQARVSNYHLTRALVAEHAPDAASWRARAAAAREQFDAISNADVHAALAHRLFPTHHIMLVLEPGPYSPPLSSRLVHVKPGLRAGQQLLDDAEDALECQRYEQAYLLANAAAKRSKLLAPAAQSLAATARQRRTEQRDCRRAARQSRSLEMFFDQLDKLTLDDLTTPLEALTVVRTHFNHPQLLDAIYRDRVRQLALDEFQCAGNDEHRRTRALEILALHSDGELRAAYRTAAGMRRASPVLAAFGKAFYRQQQPAAATAAREATRLLGPVPVIAELLDELNTTRQPELSAGRVE
jgi:hypothetical protein